MRYREQLGDYHKFYEQLSKNSRPGAREDSMKQAKIVEPTRYHTSKSGDEQTGLKEYADRWERGQNKIYRSTGDSVAAVFPSPCPATFWKNGLEVLYMVDHIDEYVLMQLTELDGREFTSTTKEGLAVGDMIKEMPEDVVEKVLVKLWMADSPFCPHHLRIWVVRENGLQSAPSGSSRIYCHVTSR